MGSSLSHTEISPASSTSLLSLPNELLLLVSTHLDRASHIHSLILTNRRLNFLLTPTLHTYARLPVSISPKETLTSLQWASMNGHVPLIRLLLSHPDNKDLDTVATHTRNRQSPSCATALHHAIARGDEEIMKLLLDAGARCDIQDSFGDTAVHAAVTRANSLAGKRKFAWLPLPFRGWETETRILRVLLEYGPPLDIGNNKGDTPLHIAVSGAVPCAATVTEALLGSGAQVNVRNGWKYTPLHVAAMAGVVEVVEVLMRGGADIDADGEWCLTPGKLAEARGFTGVVRVLVRGRGILRG